MKNLGKTLVSKQLNNNKLNKMEVKVSFSPEGKGEEVSLKIQKIVEDRSAAIAKRFNTEVKNVDVKVYNSTNSLRVKINPNDDQMGVYGGYIDGSNEILLAHPAAMQPVYKENLDKELIILIDYCLTKFYICKLFFPELKDFKMYYKYISDILAQITSGNFRENIVKFEIKTYTEGKKCKKDKELIMVLFIMLNKSGLDFIYSHLEEIIKDEDITKTIFKIYKKSFSELILQYQKELQEQDKKLAATFKPGRR